MSNDTKIITNGRRSGKTAATIEALRASPGSAMLAKDDEGTRALAGREELTVEPVLRDGKPTGNVFLRAKP